ncbi:MAG TPA: hypothetical protein VH853_17265 [Polyangia bacterium]|jgi:hypothetical protein|nr:hypothetical protein [Polyangia bacterium]
MSLLAASLSLFVACGGGQSPGRGDATDGGRLDGPSDRVTQPTADAPRDAPVARADAATGSDVRVDTRVAADAAADARPDVHADTRVAIDAVR